MRRDRKSKQNQVLIETMFGVMLDTFMPFLIFCYGWCYAVDAACKPISIQDINDALQLSTQCYNPILYCLTSPCKALKKGDRVAGAPGYRVDAVYTSQLGIGSLKAVVATKPKTRNSNRTTIIAFRGTTSKGQMRAQFRSGTVEEWETLPYPGNMRVMKYDLDSVNELDLINKVSLTPGTKYIITGHSLGGALATVFAVQVHYRYKNFWKRDNNLITFGSPRVGDAVFAKQHDLIIPPEKKLRIVNNRDLVPHLPLLSFGFRHVNREIFIHETRLPKTTFRKCGWLWCPHVEMVTHEDWKVCPLQQGLFTCSKGLLVGRKQWADHGAPQYIAAVDTIREDPGRMRKFLRDQCSDSKNDEINV